MAPCPTFCTNWPSGLSDSSYQIGGSTIFPREGLAAGWCHLHLPPPLPPPLLQKREYIFAEREWREEGVRCTTPLHKIVEIGVHTTSIQEEEVCSMYIHCGEKIRGKICGNFPIFSTDFYQFSRED